MSPSSQWVLLARLLRPQGRKGEVLAELLTDFPARFAQHPQVWLAPPGVAEAEPAAPGHIASVPEPAQVVSHWLPVGRNSGRIVLHFAGVCSIEQAEQLAGKEVLIPLPDRLPLEADAAYISDLVGCTVFDRGRALGTVEAVQFPTTPDGLRRLEDAAPLLAIAAPEGSELLIPFVKSYLLELDTTAKVIRMALPEGLADLNRNPGAPP